MLIKQIPTLRVLDTTGDALISNLNIQILIHILRVQANLHCNDSNTLVEKVPVSVSGMSIFGR